MENENEKNQQQIVSPERTRELLKKHEINYRRSLGQNFLIDGGVLASLISSADLDCKENVVEIGPGLGALTQAILQEIPQGKLLTVEKDEELADILQNELGDIPQLKIIEGDALDLNWAGLLKDYEFAEGYKLMANLPYYITSPLIRTFLELELPPEVMVLMVQKEVAERITASPGGKEYGVLSIAVQYYCHPEIIEFVPASSFTPQPEVDSAILRLNLAEGANYQVYNEKLFFALVRAMFQQRRKMLRNSLSKAAEIDLDKETVKRALKKSDIDSRLRGEKLSIKRIVKLSNILDKILSGNGDSYEIY